LDDLVVMAGQNCGQFILDNPAAAHMLNGWLHACNTDGSYWNGDAGMVLALLSFRGSDYRCRFKKVHHRIINSLFPHYDDGDLAISFPDHMVKSRERLIRQFLEFTDFSRGRVDRRRTDLLDRDDPGIGDWRQLEAIYEQQVNVPCRLEDD
jgi:hypothetical protein